MTNEMVSDKMLQHYRNVLLKNGANAQGVDWRDEETALIRHDKMSQLILNITDNTTLLDVGCGFGAFLDFLQSKKVNLKYNGIDLVREMIEIAQKNHPLAGFLIGDFLKTDFGTNFDYLVCNGILTQKLDVSLLEMDVYFKRLIKKMFDICEIGCCFNIMTTRVNFFSPNLFYRHPAEIITYCLSEITSNIKVDHSYGLYEYTVYLYK